MTEFQVSWGCYGNIWNYFIQQKIPELANKKDLNIGKKWSKNFVGLGGMNRGLSSSNESSIS